MLVEEQLEQAQKAIERQIKMELLERSMTQAKLAILIGESRAAVNQAIKGNMNPQATKIRKKIYKALGMK